MRILAASALLLALAVPALAQSPTDEQIPYQGVLSDAGVPLADGNKSLIFSLADADGSFWTESATVTTTDGAFAHRLGSVTTLTGIDFSVPVSLTITYTPSAGSPVIFGPTALGAVPTAHFAQTAGAVALPLVGAVDTPLSGAAVTVSNAGVGAGLSASSAGSALRVTDAGEEGLQILATDKNGITIVSAGETGLEIETAADDGLRIGAAGLDGIHVEMAGGDGFRVGTAVGDGLSIGQAQNDAIRIQNAGQDGLRIGGAGDDGIEISSADGDGVVISTAGGDGVFVAASTFNGLNVGVAGGAGLFIFRTAGQGIDIGTTGDTDADGTPETTADGVNVAWAGGDGVEVARANGYGVRAEGDAGSYLRTSDTNVTAPDLTLGGLAASDNGVISTDPAFTSSDLFVTSNDDITFYIDDNIDGDVGQFEIRNGVGTPLLRVKEDGTITPFGGTYGAENAVRIDDPTAPTARALTLPSVVSSERMVAFSGNVVTDASGTAVVQLPDYADAVAGDFRYQLTAIGSFAQAIIGQKVSDGTFTVRTSEPGVEVSWRVEGVRQDAWARANEHQAVANKDQPGTYVHPAAYGAPTDAVATEDDPEGELTPEGRIQLDLEAEEARESERRDAAARALRDAETTRDATPSARRSDGTRG